MDIPEDLREPPRPTFGAGVAVALILSFVVCLGVLSVDGDLPLGLGVGVGVCASISLVMLARHKTRRIAVGILVGAIYAVPIEFLVVFLIVAE